MSTFTGRTALVTGATSGLGFEAAAQLAEAGYGTVTVSGRTESRIEAARVALVERTGRDVFATVVVDVASIESAERAAADLVDRSGRFDTVILNAGMVPAELSITADGIEEAFAASLVGHQVITEALLGADLLDGSTVVIVGSEAANDDLPKMMGMGVYDFAKGEPSAFGDSPAEAMRTFAVGGGSNDYDGNRQYSTVKVFSAWWSAAMARRHAGTRFITVSPGSNMGTDAARHTTGAFRLMLQVMRRIGRFVGMNMPTAEGAKRYLDVAHGVDGSFENGRTYTSRPKRMVGPLVRRDDAHLVDVSRQDTALAVLDELARVRV